MSCESTDGVFLRFSRDTLWPNIEIPKAVKSLRVQPVFGFKNFVEVVIPGNVVIVPVFAVVVEVDLLEDSKIQSKADTFGQFSPRDVRMAVLDVLDDPTLEL